MLDRRPNFELFAANPSQPRVDVLNLTLIQTTALQLSHCDPIYFLFFQATSETSQQTAQLRFPGCLALIEEFLSKSGVDFNFDKKEDCKRAIFEATLRGICHFATNSEYTRQNACELVWGVARDEGGLSPNAIDFASELGEEFKPQELCDALFVGQSEDGDCREAQLKAAFVYGWREVRPSQG